MQRRMTSMLAPRNFAQYMLPTLKRQDLLTLNKLLFDNNRAQLLPDIPSSNWR
jgi:hypothetical protein